MTRRQSRALGLLAVFWITVVTGFALAADLETARTAGAYLAGGLTVAVAVYVATGGELA